MSHGMRSRLTHRIAACQLFAAFAALALTGCASSKKKEAEKPIWTPKPLVGWEYVSIEPVAPLTNDFRVVASLPTKGLFPADMGVTRVALVSDAVPFSPTEGKTVPVIFKDPRNEFLQWNSALDDQLAVSEVFPIDHFALGGGDARPAQIVASLRALHARLGLIYAVNELSPDSAEILGTIYDVEAARPIAHIHASATSLPIPEDTKEDDIDLWETDARARVRARFEILVYQCLYQLIKQDQPAKADAPEGWIPVTPRLPVEWPPQLPPPRNGR